MITPFLQNLIVIRICEQLDDHEYQIDVERRVMESNTKDLAEYLVNHLHWRKTTEGTRFWANVYHSLYNNDNCTISESEYLGFLLSGEFAN